MCVLVIEFMFFVRVLIDFNCKDIFLDLRDIFYSCKLFFLVDLFI